MISKVAGNNVSFGHKVIIDTGASKPNNGSFKVVIVSDETGKEIHNANGFVCPEGFKKNEDFLDGLVERIKETYNEVVNTGKLTKLSKEDQKLTGLIIHSPGVSVGNITDEIGNLKLVGTNTPLININYNEIPESLRPILKKMGVDISPEFKLMATNDMIGAGASIVTKLLDNPEFKKGYKAVFLMAGGGLGVGEITHLGDNVLIETSEGGHIRVNGTNKNLEQYGASSTALIRNFAEAVGLKSEDVEKLVKVGNAKIVRPNLVLNNEKEVESLMNTGLFKVLAKDSEGTKLQLKDGNQKCINNAVKKAIGLFIEAISIAGSNKVTEGVNEIILTGPLTKGIQEIVNNHSDLFNKKSFKDLVDDKISSFLDSSGEGMKKAYKLKLVTDLEIPNNTVGGSLALKGDFVRGNCLSIPTSVFNKQRTAHNWGTLAKVGLVLACGAAILYALLLGFNRKKESKK